MDRFPELSAFTLAFAAAYRGFMKESNVTGKQIASKLRRNVGYVSERVNGKRSLDTEDVDALAMLVPGWSGKDLMVELARRTREAMTRPEAIVHQFPMRSVPAMDQDLPEVAGSSFTSPDPDDTDDQYDNS